MLSNDLFHRRYTGWRAEPGSSPPCSKELMISVLQEQVEQCPVAQGWLQADRWERTLNLRLGVKHLVALRWIVEEQHN